MRQITFKSLQLKMLCLKFDPCPITRATDDMPALAELRAIRGVLEAAVRYALDL